MRLPRMRATVCGLMVVVALIASFLGGVQWGIRLGRRSEAYKRMADSELKQEMKEIKYVWINENKQYYNGKHQFIKQIPVALPIGFPSLDHLDGKYRKQLKEIELHAGLRRKYERAADYPWLPGPAIPPDPGERALKFAKSAQTRNDYESTAIYLAALDMEKMSPGFLARNMTATAGSADNNLWVVTFTDTSTNGQLPYVTSVTWISVEEFRRKRE